jgi:CRP-like cAMP-binding protein
LSGTPDVDADDVISLLSRSESCRDLCHDDLRAIASAGSVRTCAEHDDLMREGEPGRSMILLVVGSVKILKRDDEGLDRELATIGAGAVLGEAALLEAMPRTATVRAATPVRYFEIDREAFERLLDARDPAAVRMVLALARVLARRQRETNEKLAKHLLDASRQTSRATDTGAYLQSLVIEVEF